MGDLPPPETDPYLNFAALFQKATGITDLVGYIILPCLGTQADFLDLSYLLSFSSFLFLLGALVYVFAIVQQTADRRASVGGNLDQI
jgi:hypothetical protein